MALLLDSLGDQRHFRRVQGWMCGCWSERALAPTRRLQSGGEKREERPSLRTQRSPPQRSRSRGWRSNRCSSNTRTLISSHTHTHAHGDAGRTEQSSSSTPPNPPAAQCLSLRPPSPTIICVSILSVSHCRRCVMYILHRSSEVDERIQPLVMSQRAQIRNWAKSSLPIVSRKRP